MKTLGLWEKEDEYSETVKLNEDKKARLEKKALKICLSIV